jgi:hypothetical protein
MDRIQCENFGLDLEYCQKYFKPRRHDGRATLCFGCRRSKEQKQNRIRVQRHRRKSEAKGDPSNSPSQSVLDGST